MHIDNERRGEPRKQCSLIHDALNAFLGHDPRLIIRLQRFKHFFHGVLVPGFVMLHLPDLPEPALPDDVLILE